MSNEDGDLNEIFAVRLTREVKNFPSEGDLNFIRNKFSVASNIPIAVFDTTGNWVSTHEA